jgi:hypothetical protein
VPSPVTAFDGYIEDSTQSLSLSHKVLCPDTLDLRLNWPLTQHGQMEF